MRNLLLISILFVSQFVAAQEDRSLGPLLSNAEREIVLFFSPNCDSCYRPVMLTSAWRAMNPSVSVRMLPVHNGGDLQVGARLYLMVEISKSSHELSHSKRIKTVFALLRENPDLEDSITSFSKLFKKHGLHFNNIQFVRWWDASSVMLADIKLILSEINVKITEIPFARVYSNSSDEPFFVQANDVKEYFALINGEF
jgi:hypothetical protein